MTAKLLSPGTGTNRVTEPLPASPAAKMADAGWPFLLNRVLGNRCVDGLLESTGNKPL